MPKKILITGSEGMLATDLAVAATDTGCQVIGLTHKQLDVTKPHQVREALDREKPDVVVNTPGLSVDICEEHPEEGYFLHTWASRMVAQHCQRIGATVVYVSTCGVFGDEVKPYSEYNPVELKTNYARSKFLGEQAAREVCDKTFVIRPGWLFGGSPEHQRNFVYQRFLDAQRIPVLSSANDKFGSPTWTQDLSIRILELLETEEYGLYHVTNRGIASRYEYVKCIVEAFDLNTSVEPVDSSAFPRSASVPNCEALDNLNCKFLGLPPMEPWQEAIHRYVRSLQLRSS